MSGAVLPIKLDLLPPVTPAAARPEGAAAAGTGDFAALLQTALGGVNQDQAAAAAAEQALATGQIADVGQVVVAAEQARLSLDLTIAVRNKLLEAYQEVMRMPL